jgi:hypothetical protein
MAFQQNKGGPSLRPGSKSSMTVMKPRSRMISVRLSEEEYTALRQLCSLTGARSVSDLTRDAMRTVLRGVNREEPIGGNLDEFRVGMKSLEKKVEQLEAKITMFKTEGHSMTDVTETAIGENAVPDKA